MKTYNCLHCGKKNKWARQNKNIFCRGNNNACQFAYQDHVRIYNWLVKGETWAHKKNHPVPPWAKRAILKLQGGKCARCKESHHHNGEEFTFEFEHINGNPQNNAHENCEVLCVHCHTKTDTYKRKDRTKVTEDHAWSNGQRIKELLERRRKQIDDMPEPTVH